MADIFDMVQDSDSDGRDNVTKGNWIPTKSDFKADDYWGRSDRSDESKINRLQELRTMMKWGRDHDDDYWANLGHQIGGYSTDLEGRRNYHQTGFTPEQEEMMYLEKWEKDYLKKDKNVEHK
jgi:hypothetical protein